MGLFDFLKKNPDATPKQKGAKEIARLTRVVSTKLSQDYDRQEAIGILADMANAQGARALLKRFDFSMEPSITDREEKESAASGVAAAGAEALGPLREYCIRAEGMTWPLKILKQIVEPEHYEDELLQLLEQFDTEYVRNPEPKVQLLNELEQYKSEQVRLAAEPFLMDVNESVRFQAVGTVFAMGEAESLPSLVEALEDEESLRVKNRICQGIADKAWTLDGQLRERTAKVLPGGYLLGADGQISRAG